MSLDDKPGAARDGWQKTERAPMRSLLTSLLVHATLLAVALLLSRGAIAAHDPDPVRLTFFASEPAPEGGHEGGGHAPTPAAPAASPAEEAAVAPTPPPEPAPVRVPRFRRSVTRMEEEDEETPVFVDPTATEEEVASEEEIDAEAVEAAAIETEATETATTTTTTTTTVARMGTGSGTGTGTGSGSGGGSGTGRGTGTGSGTGAGTGTGGAGSGGPIYLSAGMERPRRLQGREPTYTRQAREAHVEGDVVVRIEITREGRVRDVVVLTGLPFLDEEVVRTVRRWRFSPPIVGGRAVPIYMIQRITFRTR